MDKNQTVVEILDGYISKEAFLQRFPNLFKAQELKWLITNRDNNGFAEAVSKVSRQKILLHIPSVLAWLDSRAAKNTHKNNP